METACIVDILCFPLAVASQRLADLGALLSPDEAQRASRFRFPRDRDRFVAARGMLRETLGSYLGEDPARLVFRYGRYGKPVLADRDGAVSFNISHSGDAAVLAVTRGSRRVGVDIEEWRTDVDIEETARMTFSPVETAAILSLPPAERARVFFDCWTRKEAFVKALGRGFSLPLEDFDVAVLPGDPVRLLRARWDRSEHTKWTFLDLPVGPSCAGTLVVEGSPATAHFRDSAAPAGSPRALAQGARP